MNNSISGTPNVYTEQDIFEISRRFLMSSSLKVIDRNNSKESLIALQIFCADGSIRLYLKEKGASEAESKLNTLKKIASDTHYQLKNVVTRLQAIWVNKTIISDNTCKITIDKTWLDIPPEPLHKVVNLIKPLLLGLPYKSMCYRHNAFMVTNITEESKLEKLIAEIASNECVQ